MPLKLKPFVSGSSGFPSLLNFFGFIEEGILLGKDGSYTQCFYVSCPDTDSCTVSQIDALNIHVAKILNRLDGGWTVQFDFIRRPALDYPRKNFFSDATSGLIEEGRRLNHEREGTHFESVYVFSLTYKSSLKIPKLRTRDSEGESKGVLENFKYTCSEIQNGLNTYLSVSPMSTQETFTYLHNITLGAHAKDLVLPDPPCYLSYLLGGHDLIGGLQPSIDGKPIRCVSIQIFPAESFSGMLKPLEAFAFDFRLSQRFICIDQWEAIKKIKSLRLQHHNRQHNLLKMMVNVRNQYPDKEAIQAAGDADAALLVAQEGMVKYGYYTAVIVVMHRIQAVCDDRARQIKELLESHGFISRIETVNSLESYLGSLTSHSFANVRKPLIHTLNLAHLLLLSQVWGGLEWCPNPMLPKNSPPVLYAASTGATPFRFHIHVSDLGHFLILGPSGAGKSAMGVLIAVQFMRFKNSQVFVLDRGFTVYPITKACGGIHYDIMGNKNLCFCPLKDIHEPAELNWGAQWIEEIVALQGVSVTAKQRARIREALIALSQSSGKTLSDLLTNLQDPDLKVALKPYTICENGPMGHLLDATKDTLQESRFQVYELGALLDLDKRFFIPVSRYLFHQFERRLDGVRPTLILIDEAWALLDNGIYQKKIREWLKITRAKNCAIGFVTQSVADITNSAISDVIIESCPTKIFLPNPEATTQQIKPLYESLGLNEREIEIIQSAIPKHHYYYTSPHGKRLIELGLDDVVLSFIGKNSREDLEAIQRMEREFPNNWPAIWLKKQGLESAAKRWEAIKNDLDKNGVGV